MHSIFTFLWGMKTSAIFDVWTIEHIVGGISIGHAIKKRNHRVLTKILNKKEHDHHSSYFDIVGVLFLAYVWEALEHYLEIGLAGPSVAYWFQGVEFWLNRLVVDPLMFVLGYLIAKRFPGMVWPARVFSFAWLFFHIVVFPHSMFLQEFL